jgi:hypothetical protein
MTALQELCAVPDCGRPAGFDKHGKPRQGGPTCGQKTCVDAHAASKNQKDQRNHRQRDTDEQLQRDLARYADYLATLERVVGDPDRAACIRAAKVNQDKPHVAIWEGHWEIQFGDCSHALVDEDEDGDHFCLMCGRSIAIYAGKAAGRASYPRAASAETRWREQPAAPTVHKPRLGKPRKVWSTRSYKQRRRQLEAVAA